MSPGHFILYHNDHLPPFIYPAYCQSGANIPLLTSLEEGLLMLSLQRTIAYHSVMAVGIYHKGDSDLIHALPKIKISFYYVKLLTIINSWLFNVIPIHLTVYVIVFLMGSLKSLWTKLQNFNINIF